MVVPKCIYTEPELASVGDTAGSSSSSSSSSSSDISGATAAYAITAASEVTELVASLRGNDRAILEGESDDGGFALVRCRADSGQGARSHSVKPGGAQIGLACR